MKFEYMKVGSLVQKDLGKTTVILHPGGKKEIREGQSLEQKMTNDFETSHSDEVLTALNELGQDGWEVVSTVNTAKLKASLTINYEDKPDRTDYNPFDIEYLLKRKIKSPQD